MFSTRFNIILSEPQRLGLSDSEATLLLDETVAAYVEEFKEICRLYGVVEYRRRNDSTHIERTAVGILPLFDTVVNKFDINLL